MRLRGDILTPYCQHSEQSVVIINHGLGDRLVVMATDSTLVSTGEEEGNEESPVEWRDYTTEEYQQGYRLYIQHDQVCM